MTTDRKHLTEVARTEVEQWQNLPRGIVIAILFAFIHRVTIGEDVMETFFKPKQVEPDYEI